MKCVSDVGEREDNLVIVMWPVTLSQHCSFIPRTLPGNEANNIVVLRELVRKYLKFKLTQY